MADVATQVSCYTHTNILVLPDRTAVGFEQGHVVTDLEKTAVLQWHWLPSLLALLRVLGYQRTVAAAYNH